MPDSRTDGALVETPEEPFEVTAEVVHQMVRYCLAALPDEGCGVLAAGADGTASRCYPTRNAAASARIYTVDPGDFLRADIDAESSGLQIVGVFHSHTHTDPYPSPTDVGQAPDPLWHYVLVSLRHEVASIRSYRIRDGNIQEERVVVSGRYNPTS